MMNPFALSPIDQAALFIAINHYVTTADTVGHGTVITRAGRFGVMIPVKRGVEQDQADFAAFRSRFDELAPRYELELEPTGASALGMDVWVLWIDPAVALRVASELCRRPGPAGWGSMYPLLVLSGLTIHAP